MGQLSYEDQRGEVRKAQLQSPLRKHLMYGGPGSHQCIDGELRPRGSLDSGSPQMAEAELGKLSNKPGPSHVASPVPTWPKQMASFSSGRALGYPSHNGITSTLVGASPSGFLSLGP